MNVEMKFLITYCSDIRIIVSRKLWIIPNYFTIIYWFDHWQPNYISLKIDFYWNHENWSSGILLKPQYNMAVFLDVLWVCHGCFQEEESLMNFHISNLEFACGDTLRNVSALHWDQNEDYPQFSGENLVLPGGISQVLSKLAEGLDIDLDTKVICFLNFSLGKWKIRENFGKHITQFWF